MTCQEKKHHPTTLLNQLAIILVRPKIAENIGAAARICFNMGIKRLLVVSDRSFPREAMAKMATHKAAHLIDHLPLYPRLEDALEDFSIAVGTTARKGKQRFANQNPRQLVDSLMPLIPNNKCAILFGPEDTGLTNEELKHCQFKSSIPTAEFSSLNLAQAVAIHCYELYHGIHYYHTPTKAPELATIHELESMYNHVEQALGKIRFFEESGKKHWMANIRNLLGRIQLTSKDANIVRGICKKFLYYDDR